MTYEVQGLMYLSPFFAGGKCCLAAWEPPHALELAVDRATILR